MGVGDTTEPTGISPASNGQDSRATRIKADRVFLMGVFLAMTVKGDSEKLERSRSKMSVIELCDAGRYREARAALEGLRPESAEDFLALGIVETYRGDLGAAKDHLSRVAFGSSGLVNRAKAQLALAYYHSGEIAEGRAILSGIPDSFEKLLNKAIMEDRQTFALRILEKASRFKARPGMQARLHNQRGLILRRMRKLDRAIQEYEAALFFFEQDESDIVPVVVNNLARVYLEFKEFERAHSYVDRAIELFKDDPPYQAQALDEKALILLAEGKAGSAKQFSLRAVSILQSTDRKEWLVGALLTYAKTLRAEQDERELEILREAAEICAFLQRDDLLIGVLQARAEWADALLWESEKRALQLALAVTNGTSRAAAEKLGTTHASVLRRMKKYGLKSH